MNKSWGSEASDRFWKFVRSRPTRLDLDLIMIRVRCHLDQCVNKVTHWTEFFGIKAPAFGGSPLRGVGPLNPGYSEVGPHQSDIEVLAGPPFVRGRLRSDIATST